MPFLSVIVVTWNNENHIEQALASCIDLNASNYEVVVVHNASDDRTGELIQRAIKSNEHIFRVIENERNEGLGEARNIGVRNALGEYFIFLDGDDWFERGAIGALFSKLQEHGTDVLLYDYQRVWDTGWKEGNKLKHLLQEHDASRPIERRSILSVFGIACNKAYRKSFIDAHKIKFSEGYYEDVTWTYEILLRAESIYVTPMVVLNYRQRNGSILRSTDERHLILPERYDYLRLFLSCDPALLEEYGQTMFKLARNHLLSRVVWPRLPKSQRSLYLKKSNEVMDKWRELIHITNPGWTLRIAGLGSPLLYELAKKFALWRKVARKKTGSLLAVGQRFLYKNIFCRLPIERRRAYFEAYWGEKLDGNPISLAQELSKRGGHEIFVGIKKGLVGQESSHFKTVTIGSIKFWYVVATSYLLVSDANLSNQVRKRKNTVHLQTKHGTPLKHMGIDNRGKPLHSMNWGGFASRCRRWDFVLSSNPYSSKIWRQAFPYEYKVLELGYPRNDVFFNTDSAELERIRAAVGVPPGKRVALYAPTFKDYNRDESFCPDVSFDDMRSALGDEYVLLVRAHKFAMAEMGDELKNMVSVIDVSDYISANEICLISDVLITDYSSIMFDYACLKRPIILFQYDYDQYVEARGVYFDIQEEAPGIVVDTAGGLLEALRSKSFNSEENVQKLHKFNAKFCPWDDGNATERVLNTILF